jgi:hypothetical protein
MLPRKGHPHNLRLHGALLIALGIIFFGSLVLAAQFPLRPYDWRHTVISSLGSPRDNPRGYVIACAGVAVSGLLLLPFAGYLRDRLAPFAPRLVRWAALFLRLAAIGMTLSAVIVPGHYRILGLARTHEHLAQVSAVAFCLSLILYFAALLRMPGRFVWIRIFTGVIVLLPVTSLIVSRLALWLSYDFAGPQMYQAIKTSLWSSLALWEWVGAGCIFLFLGLLVLGIYSEPVGSNSSDVSSSK